AIEGPRASKRAPDVVLVRNHVPAARPPATPPVPARNVVDDGGCMRDQLACASEPNSTTTSNVLNATSTPRAPRRRGKRPSARPASTAIGGAIGSKYW